MSLIISFASNKRLGGSACPLFVRVALDLHYASQFISAVPLRLTVQFTSFDVIFHSPNNYVFISPGLGKAPVS